MTDLLLTGARVWTGVGGAPFAEAVAIRGDRVLAVGRLAEVLELTGPAPQRRELDGRLVVPGFHDAHVHPPFAGRFLLHLTVHELTGLRAVLDAVRTYADANPDLPWIYGGGWEIAGLDGFEPTAALLDEVVPDRPVFLLNASVHEAWLNTAALDRAGITAATPDPSDGYIVRDAGGNPTGRLLEGAAYSFQATHVPPPDVAGWQAAILRAQSVLHGHGITGWQDAWVEPPVLAAYRGLDGDGRLTGRVSTALWWQRERGLEQVEEFVAARAAYPSADRAAGTSRLRTSTVKIMVDGVVENHTSAMLSPFLDGCGQVGCAHPDGGDGLVYVDPGLLGEALTRLDALGFQVHLHTIGDRAVRVALDAIETARSANGPSGNRHTLAHIQVVHPDDVPRFAALDVVANCQALWAQSEPAMDDFTIPFLGLPRAGWQYPFAALAASGARLAMGSDWPVSTPDPLAQIDVAVNRSERGRTAAFLPEQALPLVEALTAFTAGSAFVNHDDDAGVLAPGRRADLAVLSHDVLPGRSARSPRRTSSSPWPPAASCTSAEPADRPGRTPRTDHVPRRSGVSCRPPATALAPVVARQSWPPHASRA